jgi:hypothetical protein
MHRCLCGFTFVVSDLYPRGQELSASFWRSRDWRLESTDSSACLYQLLLAPCAQFLLVSRHRFAHCPAVKSDRIIACTRRVRNQDGRAHLGYEWRGNANAWTYRVDHLPAGRRRRRSQRPYILSEHAACLYIRTRRPRKCRMCGLSTSSSSADKILKHLRLLSLASTEGWHAHVDFIWAAVRRLQVRTECWVYDRDEGLDAPLLSHFRSDASRCGLSGAPGCNSPSAGTCGGYILIFILESISTYQPSVY